MALPIGNDPYQSVQRGLEGTGAAYINKENTFLPTLLAKGFEVKLAKEKEKEKGLKDAKDRLKAMQASMKGWRLRDGKILGEMTEDLVKEGARLLSKGVDPLQQEAYMNQWSQATQLAESSAEHEVLYKDLFDKNWQAKQADTLTDGEYEHNEKVIETWAATPVTQRTGDLMSQLIAPTKRAAPEKPIDYIGKINSGINVGYYSQRELDDKGQGYDQKSVKQNDLRSQAKSFVNANPALYESGITDGLWKTKKEAEDFAYNYKLYQADTSIKDIFRSTPEDNVFGTGYNQIQVKEDFEKWKQDLINGDEEAAAFLTGVKLPSGEILGANKLLASRKEGAAGTQYDYMTEMSAVEVDGVTTKREGTLKFVPEDMTDQELFKLYIDRLDKGKHTYGMDISKTTSRTKVDKGTTKKPKPY